MNDLLASERTLDQPSDNGQVGRASEAQPQEATGGQPSDNGKAAQDENIRKLQSTYDKKLAEKERTFQQQQQYAQQQIAAMQQRLAQMEEANAPDDYSRLELKLKRAEETVQQYAAAYQQQIQAQEVERKRNEALHEIADEFELPLEDLKKAVEKAGANDYAKAARVAAKLQLERERRKQDDDDDKRERNRPDVGGGRTSTPSTRWEQQYEDARNKRDSVEMARLLRTRGTT